VIRGGTVVTDSWSGAATVTVAGGRITGVLDPATEVDGAEVLDATGLLVMPGGVDPHCHVAVPLGEFVTLDSFESASLAALAGGTTTIIDFAIPATGEGSIAALEAKLAMAKDSRCDYAFHGCINAPGPDIADVVRRYVEEGVRTVKLFTTYRGLLMVEIDTIEQVMRALNAVSGLTYVHAESNQLVEAAQAEAESAGRIGAAGMARTRPEAAEARAVQEVLGAAERTGAPVYFVHQTIPAAVDEVIAARQRGVRAFSESCPHYLVLDESCYAGEHPERYVCCPPIRSRAAVDVLGDRLAKGYVHTVGSDHCCYDTGQKELRAHDVRAMPNGLPGVETRLSVVWDAYVASGRISPERFVAVMAAGPGPAERALPAQGRDRAGGRRRPRAVRPGRDPRRPHGRAAHGDRLHALRGSGGHGLAAHRPRPGPGRGPRRRAHRPRPGGAVPARGPHRPDVSDPGEATRRAVLGDEHVDRSDAAITPFSRPLMEYRTRAGWGEVWSRDGLDRRARSLVTLGVLVALRAHDELAVHVRGAVRNGLSPEEIAEVLLHTAVYAGMPAALAALRVAERALVEIGSLPG
jgi:dihydropyrimidinase